MTSPSEDCSSLFVSGSNDVNPDDDNISVSSTIDSEHDPDEEFVVDAVLAERPHEDPTQEGAMQYLIKWENYPLHRSSWEGRDNLSSELYHQWQEQRELEVRGKHIPFDVRVFESARADIERAREGRHMLRNAKRQRLNLPLTGRLLTGHIPPQAHLSNDDPESSDEALEVGVDLGRADNVPSERERSKQTTFKGVPSSKPAQIRKTNQSSASGWQGTAKRPSEQGILRATNAPKPTQAASSMSLANKFAGKRLKATRTIISKPLLQRSSTASATSAQKARKPRTGLKSAMMDPTKTPKFMTNMRQVNMLKKKGRELNDSAPADPSVIPAGYFITPGPPQWSNSGHGSNSQSMSGAGRSDHISEFDVNQPHDLSVPNNDHSNNATISSSIPSAIKPPTGSKKVRIGKTVHFSGVNDTDDLGTTGRPEPPVRRVSLQSYQQRSMLHDLTKQASFGPHTSRNIDVAFQSLPRVTSDWLSHFGEINHVRFETVCTSVDFLSGSSTYDSEAKLASGLLTSSNAPQALAAVASNLASSGMAFYIAYPGYSVLVYPEHSTWAPLLASTSATDLRSDILKYLVFRPRCAGPMHYLDHSILSNDHSMVVNSAALRIRLMKELAAFNYETLLAPSAKGNHVFFLMFHPTEANVFHTLSLWLRACQPDCQIFHNQEAGAWKAFQSETKSAAVILHESVEKNIRSLPGLW